MRVYILFVFIVLSNIVYSNKNYDKYDNLIINLNIIIDTNIYSIYLDEENDSIYFNYELKIFPFGKDEKIIEHISELLYFVYKRRNLLFLFKNTESRHIDLVNVVKRSKCEKDYCFYILVNKIWDINEKRNNRKKAIASRVTANLISGNRKQSKFRYCYINLPWKIPTSVKLYKLYEKTLIELESITKLLHKKNNPRSRPRSQCH